MKAIMQSYEYSKNELEQILKPFNPQRIEGFVVIDLHDVGDFLTIIILTEYDIRVEEAYIDYKEKYDIYYVITINDEIDWDWDN